MADIAHVDISATQYIDALTVKLLFFHILLIILVNF